MLFLTRRLGEKIHIVNKNTGDKFAIKPIYAFTSKIKHCKSSVRIGIDATMDYDIVREEVQCDFLLYPLTKAITAMAYWKKDYTGTLQQLYNFMSNHKKFPKDIGFNQFLEELKILSKKLEEIKHFCRIEFRADSVRVFDINYLHYFNADFI